jgi:hypothetical protein
MVDCKPDVVNGMTVSPPTYNQCTSAPEVNKGLIDPINGRAQLRTLDAYKSLGKVFATLSPGVMVQLSKQMSGVVNVGVLFMTDESRSTSLLINFQPTLGLVLGF